MQNLKGKAREVRHKGELGQNMKMLSLLEKCGHWSHDDYTKNEVSLLMTDWGDERVLCVLQDVISHQHPSHTKGTGSSNGWFCC